MAQHILVGDRRRGRLVVLTHGLGRLQRAAPTRRRRGGRRPAASRAGAARGSTPPCRAGVRWRGRRRRRAGLKCEPVAQPGRELLRVPAPAAGSRPARWRAAGRRAARHMPAASSSRRPRRARRPAPTGPGRRTARTASRSGSGRTGSDVLARRPRAVAGSSPAPGRPRQACEQPVPTTEAHASTRCSQLSSTSRGGGRPGRAAASIRGHLVGSVADVDRRVPATAGATRSASRRRPGRPATRRPSCCSLEAAAAAPAPAGSCRPRRARQGHQAVRCQRSLAGGQLRRSRPTNDVRATGRLPRRSGTLLAGGSGPRHEVPSEDGSWRSIATSSSRSSRPGLDARCPRPGVADARRTPPTPRPGVPPGRGPASAGRTSRSRSACAATSSASVADDLGRGGPAPSSRSSRASRRDQPELVEPSTLGATNARSGRSASTSPRQRSRAASNSDAATQPLEPTRVDVLVGRRRARSRPPRCAGPARSASLRSSATYFCRVLAAVAGASAGHTSSTSRSTETTRPASTSRLASTASLAAPAHLQADPSSWCTSSGPRIPNRITLLLAAPRAWLPISHRPGTSSCDRAPAGQIALPPDIQERHR